MRMARKIISIVLGIAFILAIVYLVLNFSDIVSILPLDKLKVFFGGMLEFIGRSFKNIWEWMKGIIS